MLQLIDGEIYAGYGDYNANTGPIHVESVPAASPLDAWTDHVTAATEQVGVIRPLADGRILVPHLDPQSDGAAGYAERQANGAWVDRATRITATGGVHVFDIVEAAGRLWACGAADVLPTPTADGQAVVWHSTDGGATWVESLRDPHLDPESRFYCLASVGDAVWVRNPMGNTTFVWTASDGWQTAGVQMLPDMADGAPGVAWGDGYLLGSTVRVGQGEISAYYFDGTGTADVQASGLLAWTVGGDGAFYALQSPGRITRTASRAVGATPVAYLVPGAYASLCVLPGGTQALVGQADSTVGLVPLT